MYSFSTCWNSHRHTDGRVMLREVRELGFDYAELGHGTRISLVPGILEAVAAGEMKISSLHNFCPLPMGVSNAAPNLYQFSSMWPREREAAYKHTLKTIEFAQRLNAAAVVLHLGSIEMKDPTDNLLDMIARGEKDSPKFEKICLQFTEKREAKKESFVEHTTEALRKLLPEAQARGIKLGAESRQGLTELPLESDFQFLFHDLASPNLGYWHDTGHAQIKENLGFIHHAMHLESLAGRLIGFHIHDVQFPGKDHCAPGSGIIDFLALKPFVKPDHLKVFELGPGVSPEDVRAGVAHLKSIWGDE